MRPLSEKERFAPTQPLEEHQERLRAGPRRARPRYRPNQLPFATRIADALVSLTWIGWAMNGLLSGHMFFLVSRAGPTHLSGLPAILFSVAVMASGVESALCALGHDVESALSEGLSGAADLRLLAACGAEDRILVTLDMDFADIREYTSQSHRGIWARRPPQQTVSVTLHLVLAAVKLASSEKTAGQLWVVDGRRVRIRT